MMQPLSLLESLIAGGIIFSVARVILREVAKDDPKSRARGAPICIWVAVGFATAGYAMQYGAGLGLLVGLMIGHIHLHSINHPTQSSQNATLFLATATVRS